MNNGLIGFPDSSRTQAGITFSPVRFRVPAWRLDVRISSEFIALCAQAYVQLRGFSWQLRLAPFSFEALVVALVTPQDSPLRDEVRPRTHSMRAAPRCYGCGHQRCGMREIVYAYSIAFLRLACHGVARI